MADEMLSSCRIVIALFACCFSCNIFKPTSAQSLSQISNLAGTRTFLDRIFTQYGENNGTVIRPQRFKDLLKQLSIGNVYIERLDKSCLYKGVHQGIKQVPMKDDGAQKQGQKSSDAGHEHDRKRRSGDHGKQKEEKQSPKHQKHIKSHYQKCLSTKDLLHKHKLNDTDSITRATFLKICPALVEQINGGFCVHRHNCSEKPYYLSIVVDRKMVWVYGFLAITFVSLASLAIIAVIPCLEKGFYQRVMGYLVALAVGTLAGDALLHLIPHAFQSLLSTSEAEHKKNIWKSCFILLGMYAFFFVEQMMKAKEQLGCCNKKKVSKKHSHAYNDEEAKQPLNDNSMMTFKEMSKKEEAEQNGEQHACHGSKSNSNDSPDATSDTELIAFPVGSNHHDDDPHHHLELHDHHQVPHDLEHDHGHSHGTIDKDTSIATVAWMVIVGDGFHNFSDGLAIGAAFAASYSSGIGTTIAVFCHELPHELGDFAVLIKSGMSIRQAICYNLVSAVLSYIGLVIGIIVGNYSDDGKQFALAITAGLFLYVALANMLPELTSAIADDKGDLWSFISPHLGILSGIVIMLLISIFEDKF